MKLKFKSVQGSTFTIDAEPTDSIASIKGKIETQHSHPAASQKIIYSGKILTDADTVQSCGVSEKAFLVLMVSKPKATKATPAPAAAPAESSTTTAAATTTTAPAAAIEPVAASTPVQSAPGPAPATAAGTAEAASTAPAGSSQFLIGSAREDAINNMVEMGFERGEVQKAMHASFNNPERAVEYLMTGIPAHLNQTTQQNPAETPTSAPTEDSTMTSAATSPAPTAPAITALTPAAAATTTTTAPPAAANPRAGNLFEAAAAAAQGGGGATGGGAGGLSSLQGMEDDGSGRSMVDLGNPAMLAQLRQLVQQNPAALNPLVQALAQSNPRLASAMAEDPEGVLNLLAAGAAGGGGGEEGEEGMTLPAMDELNPEDRTAVEQIIAMGIPETKAIEAYLMCGRNVEMAVQYYFENPQDFDD
ncbi:hypothetical protein CBS101457_005921 [Exobasidium rhododendri]|nr:hypothetical protein CBS101457_005921 [Exobasidium rhododendri]